MDIRFDEIDNLRSIYLEKQIDAFTLKKLWEKFRLEWNYNSNHIEGNTLTYDETKLLLIFDQTTGNHFLREYEEMKGHDVGIELIKMHASEVNKPLTESFIRDLNKLLLVKPFYKPAIAHDGIDTQKLITPGEYKTTPNSVRLSNGEIFEYTQPRDVGFKMQELVANYNAELAANTMHPIALAAKLHYDFVRIHPFDDGNGRVARLLLNLVLLNYNYLPAVIKSENKKEYLKALNLADTIDIKYFIEYLNSTLLWSYNIALEI